MATEHTFNSLDAANAVREQYEEHLCSDDDQRLKTVTFSSDTPDAIIEDVEQQAFDSHGDGVESVTVPLTEDERGRIKDADGFDRTTTVANWRSAKGVFAREGMTDRFHDAIPALADWDDPSEGAGDWIRDAQEFGESGGKRNHGHEQVNMQRKRARAARQAQAGQFSETTIDYCKQGEQDACEFLIDVCGYSDDEVQEFLDPEPVETEQTELVSVGGKGEYEEMELSPETAGALSASWTGYRSAVSELDDLLDKITEEINHARKAWAAINSIREAHGQEEIQAQRLQEVTDALDSMPQSIPEIARLSDFAEDSGNADAALDEQSDTGDTRESEPTPMMENQQSRLKGGEMGERGQGEPVETVEENPGGLMADKRENVGSDEPRESEQGDLSAVGVSEGLRDTNQHALDDTEDTE